MMNRSISFKGRMIPLWIMVCLLVPLTVTVVMAASSVTTTNSTLVNGENYVLSDNLTGTPQGIDVEDSALTIVGNVQGTPVEMTAAGSAANEDTVVGHYIYVYKIEVATLDADQEYSVTMTIDGSPETVLYIDQANTPVAADYVTCTWDIGTTLSSAVYEVEVLEV